MILAFERAIVEFLATWTLRVIVIEQVMVFALGFLLAGLVALAFAPVFWARAVRLSVRRLEMQLPLSMREILADRDQVRAESAIEQRRVELKAEALNVAHAANLAELGRQAMRITQMQEHLSGLRQTNASLSLDLSRLNRAHAELSTEASALSKELYDLGGLREREKDKLQALSQAHQSVLALADEQRASLASLAACGAVLETRLVDTERALRAAQTMLYNKEAEATLLSSHLERARDDLATSDAAHSSAVERYERERGRGLELQNRLTEAQQSQEEQLSKFRALTAKLETRESELRDGGTREQELRRKHDALLERMHSMERGLIDRIDRLRAENAALQGALGAARQEQGSVSRESSRQGQGKPFDEASSLAMKAETETVKAHTA